jgi:hypothetical protein
MRERSFSFPDLPARDLYPCVNLPLVHELVDGTLTAQTARRIEAHLLVCDVCSAERTFVVELKQEAGSLPRLDPGDALWAGIAASLTTASDDGDEDGHGGVCVEGDLARDATARERAPRYSRSWMRGLSAAAAVIGVCALTASTGPERLAQIASPSTRGVSTPLRNENRAPRTDAAQASGRTEKKASMRSAEHPRGESADVPVAAVAAFQSEAVNGDAARDVARQLDRWSSSLGPGIPAGRAHASEEAQIALERERLAEAEGAIRTCTDALRENPDDQRVRDALLRAMEQRVSALRSLAAVDARARRNRASPSSVMPVSMDGSRSPHMEW